MSSSWMFEDGIDSHVTNERKDFIEGTEKQTIRKVQLVSGEVVTAVLEGDVFLQGSKIKMLKVFHVIMDCVGNK